ncbi:MAG: hypothetical protein R3E53_17400 [Myxococcota bacterium]
MRHGDACGLRARDEAAGQVVWRPTKSSSKAGTGDEGRELAEDRRGRTRIERILEDERRVAVEDRQDLLDLRRAGVEVNEGGDGLSDAGACGLRE